MSAPCYHCLRSPHDVDCPTGGMYAARASNASYLEIANRGAVPSSGLLRGLVSPVAYDIMKEEIDRETKRLHDKMIAEAGINEPYPYDLLVAVVPDEDGKKKLMADRFGNRKWVDALTGEMHGPKEPLKFCAAGLMLVDAVRSSAELAFKHGKMPAVFRLALVGGGDHVKTSWGVPVTIERCDGLKLGTAELFDACENLLVQVYGL